MKRTIQLLPILAFVLLGAMRAHAQEISFTASVDRNAIAVGEYVRLTIALSNSSERFAPPDLGGLVIAQGPMESSSFNYVNGRMTSSVSRIWVLTATAPGKYTIGPARIKVGGGVIQTDPIAIEVSKGSAAPSDPSASQGQRSDQNLFATVSVSRNKAYVGEQVVATYLLYCRYSGLEITKYDLPKLDGFWAEEVDMGETNWEDQLRTVNGLQYRVAVLKKQILFPQKSGKLRIEALQLDCVVNRTFFNRGTVIPVRSNSVEFTAMALPPGAPPGFSGAVGELQFDVHTDRTSVKANEAVGIGVRITGRSNLKLLESPKLNFPSDFESYDPKVIDKIAVNGSGMSGSREFEYLVIPRHEGRYELDTINFSYFDTKAGAYRTLKGAPVVIEVSPGDGSPTALVQRPTKTDVEVLEHDIRYIRTGDLHLRPNGHHLFGSWPWVTGMAAPAVGFVLFLGWHRKREREIADIAGTRRKRADQVARKRLQEAATALVSDAREPFYAALAKALQGYLADKFGLGVAELTTPVIRERLATSADGSELAEAFTRLITACEMARFAPVEDRPRKELYEEAATLITRVEQRARA
ncbi:MAG: BatD family protein [Flavobacteriales bacterium]